MFFVNATDCGWAGLWGVGGGGGNELMRQSAELATQVEMSEASRRH